MKNKNNENFLKKNKSIVSSLVHTRFLYTYIGLAEHWLTCGKTIPEGHPIWSESIIDYLYLYTIFVL